MVLRGNTMTRFDPEQRFRLYHLIINFELYPFILSVLFFNPLPFYAVIIMSLLFSHSPFCLWATLVLLRHSFFPNYILSTSQTVFMPRYSFPFRHSLFVRCFSTLIRSKFVCYLAPVICFSFKNHRLPSSS